MIPEPPEHVATITDDDQLAAFVERLQQTDWIVVDTEFLRERTYYPQLCLLQIASRDEIGLIDVLAVSQFAPLVRLLAEPQVLKIFHAADQDLEVLEYRFGVAPTPIFDTQIAATLTGMGDQIGYARMVEELLGIHLPKTQTRTDWSKRPLSAQALAYAVDDVRYLAVAWPLLRDELRQRERLQWAEADSATLAVNVHQAATAADAWRRIRSWHRFNPCQQQVLAALAQWREQEAMRADRPRKWILADDALTTLAQRQPTTQAALEAIRSLPYKTAQRHGQELLSAIEQGLQQPAAALAPLPQPLTDAQKRDYKKARQVLNACAQQANIPVPALATRKELEQMVCGRRDVRTLRGWRAAVAGDKIVAAIESVGSVPTA